MSEAFAISLPIDEIQAYCAKQPIYRLSVFGSVLREDFTPDSDVDLLVEYVPGIPVTYFDMARQEIDLGEIVGRKIDLRTPAELSEYFRQQVLVTAKVIYERRG